MKLAVLRAKDTENFQGLPSDWPVQCKEVSDDYQVSGNETLMSVEELEAFKVENQSLYDNWYLTRDTSDQWLENRISEYPAISDQFDLLWHAVDNDEIVGKDTDWYKEIKAVKEKYPKPTE